MRRATRDVRLIVAPAVTLRGHVLGAGGAVGSAWWCPGVGNHSRAGAAVASDGSFSLFVPADVSGLLYLAFSADDRYVLREGLVAGSKVLDLVPQPGRRIEGRLTGLPAGRTEGWSVVARRGDLVCYGGCAPDGTFRIPSVPPGNYRVEIEFGDFAGGMDGVAAGTTDVTIAATRR